MKRLRTSQRKALAKMNRPRRIRTNDLVPKFCRVLTRIMDIYGIAVPPNPGPYVRPSLLNDSSTIDLLAKEPGVYELPGTANAEPTSH